MIKWILFFLLVAAVQGASKKEKCLSQIKECSQSDYDSYVDCVRKRQKRSADCDQEDGDCYGAGCQNSCSSCDCNYCETNTCEEQCNTCCSTRSSCTTHHCCHKRCHAECRTSGCRSSCRRSCTNKINTPAASSAVGVSPGSTSTKQAHNITTIINLSNTINNTNHIDMPIRVNNTNINNITLSTESTYTPGQVPVFPPHQPPIINIPPQVPPNIHFPPNLPPNIQHPPNVIPPIGIPPNMPPVMPPIYPQMPPVQGSCCNVISPRRCQQQPSPPFYKCFHMRSRKCGSFCSAPIMHEQPHQICDEGPQGGCHQQVVYIPQPQPRCWSVSQWPFVNCGINQNTNCDGCYEHQQSTSCHSSCFDEGYGVGPMYRQGPFYQPGYSAYPNCMQTGTCGFMGGMMGPIPGLGFNPGAYESSYLVQTSISNVNQTTANTQLSPEMAQMMAYNQMQQYNPLGMGYGMQPPMMNPYPMMMNPYSMSPMMNPMANQMMAANMNAPIISEEDMSAMARSGAISKETEENSSFENDDVMTSIHPKPSTTYNLPPMVKIEVEKGPRKVYDLRETEKDKLK